MSIVDLFENQGDPNGPINPQNLTAALHQAMADRGHADPGQPVPPAQPPVVPDPGTGGADPAAAVAQGVVAPPAAPVPGGIPAAAPPPGPPDPFATLSDEERAELVMLRQALADPERQAQIRRAYLGVAESPAPPPPPEPQLPADVDPDSFEAQTWRDLQETRRQLAELSQVQVQSREQSEAQRAQGAAQAAGRTFAQRYGHVLSNEEIALVAQTAGSLALPQALVSARIARTGRQPTQAELEEDMGKSLEFVLRSNDALLARVLGAPAPPAAAPAAPPGPPAVSPTIDNKRVLTALSTGASPGGDGAPRPTLEHRPDGRLTEASRSQVLEQLVAGMRGGEQGA